MKKKALVDSPSDSNSGSDTAIVRHHRLARGPLTLDAADYGPVSGPAVMLVHGFPDTPHSWNGVLPHLLAAGYRVVTPWLRGYTSGSADRGERYDLWSSSEDLMAWAAHLGLSRLHLVGHDWGAALAMVWNGRDSSALQSVSLLAVPPAPAIGRLGSVLSTLPAQLRLSSYMALMQSAYAPALVGRHDAAYVRALWQRWSPGWLFSDAEFEPVRRVMTDPLLAWAATRYYRGLFTVQSEQTRSAWSALFSPLSVPALAMAGELDGCMGMPFHRAMTAGARLQAKAGLQSVQLPGCGHFLQAEKPADTAQVLLNHFAQAG